MFLPFLLLVVDSIVFGIIASWGTTPTPKTIISDGTIMRAGQWPERGLEWQASGELYHGGCTPRNQSISDCYQFDLSEDPTKQLDPRHLYSPRQRIEFRSIPESPDDSTWLFTWSSYLPSPLNSSNTFFHLLQVFSQAEMKPVYYLDIQRNRDAIFKGFFTNETLAKVPISRVLDTTLYHRIEVKFGPTGYVDYTLRSEREMKAPGKREDKGVVMHVEKQGYMGTGGCYIKFGLYRKTYEGMGPARGWYGDYKAVPLDNED